MPSTSLKATVEVTTEVKLKPTVRKMLVARLEEHAECAVQVKALKGTKKSPGRMKRIEQEIESIFKTEKQGKALLAGTKLDGHGMKFVGGETAKFDKLGFMKKHGLTQADFDAFTEMVPKATYIKITHPGQGEDDE